MLLLLLPYSLFGLANVFVRRHDATVRSARRTSENNPSTHFGEYGHEEGPERVAPALARAIRACLELHAVITSGPVGGEHTSRVLEYHYSSSRAWPRMQAQRSSPSSPSSWPQPSSTLGCAS